MGKKTGKKMKADKVRQKKSQHQKHSASDGPGSTNNNPFEVHTNRQKHDVLNRKTKHEKGLPGVSRGKAFNRRKQTLLDEYKNVNKKNALIDRRLGEFDPSLTPDDKIGRRLVAERSKQEKRNVYNLDGDGADLTHYGQSLSEVERFQSPAGQSDDSDEDDGVLSKSTVSELHFGGFLKKKETPPEKGGGETADRRSFKELMGEVMTRAKEKKHERQAEREGNVELTEELDEEWRGLRGLIGSTLKRRGQEDRGPPAEVDDYDRTVRELQFEMKATPTDRLKTDVEIAAADKRELEEMEAERGARMKRGADGARPHVSADDLRGNFRDWDGEDEFEVRYDEQGRLIMPEQKPSGGLSDSSDDDVGQSEESPGQAEEGSRSESGTSAEEGDSDDDYSDIQSDPDSDEEIVPAVPPPVPEKIPAAKKKEKKKSKNGTEGAPVGSDLPFVFAVPESYEDLRSVFENRTNEERVTILDRIRKSNHPSLAVGNKERLAGMVPFLLDFFLDAAGNEVDFRLLEGVARHITELSHFAPVKSSVAFTVKLSERFGRFSDVRRTGASGRGTYPNPGLFLLFKLIGAVFPTSDYRHRVVTPTVLFMTSLLSDCSVRNLRDLGSGLFLCTLLLDFEKLSARYIPEVVNFLRGTLALALGSSGKDRLAPPFRKTAPQNGLLVPEATSRKAPAEKASLRKILFCPRPETLNDDKTKLCLLNLALGLVKRFAELYKDLASFVEIFKPSEELLASLRDCGRYSTLDGEISRCLEAIADASKTPRKSLSVRVKKPKPIMLLDPMIETNFDPTRRNKTSGDKDAGDRSRLVYKHRREMKGAIREIRRDNQFLAKHRLDEQLEKDLDRKRRVKEIYGMLSQQEGDYKAMKKTKLTIPRR